MKGIITASEKRRIMIEELGYGEDAFKFESGGVFEPQEPKGEFKVPYDKLEDLKK